MNTTLPCHTPTWTGRIVDDGKYLIDKVSGKATGLDWRCPTCKTWLQGIAADGTCYCANGHASR